MINGMTHLERSLRIHALSALPQGIAPLAAALVFGATVSFQPAAAAALAGIILALGVSLSRPEALASFALLTTAVSVNFLYDGSLFGIEILSLYKLAMLAMLVPGMLVYGLRFKLSPPLWAMAALLLISFGGSVWLPEMSASIAVKAFIGLSLPFFVLLIDWRKEVAERHTVLICMLPAVSVAAGALLHAAGVHSMLDVEFTGAVRLQGANIPPHLAMLAFLGIAVCFLEIKRRPHQALLFYGLLAVNFAILVGTGTRGPLLALAPIGAYYFFDILRQYVKGKAVYFIPLIGSVAVIGAAAYMQWDNFMKRSFERQTDTGIDLSGRTEAWQFFLGKAADSPWFGRGLGSSTVANDGRLYHGFVVPHNEYIRFYYDGGYIGVALLILSLLIVFAKVYRKLQREVKPYYVMLIAGFLIYSFSDNTLSTVQFIIPFCWYLNGLYRASTQTDTLQKEVIR